MRKSLPGRLVRVNSFSKLLDLVEKVHRTMLTFATYGRRTSWIACVAGLMLILSPLTISLAPGQDRVFPKNDTMASGKIAALNKDNVRITVRDKDQTFELSDVRKITFADEPRGLDRARELCLQGQYDSALEELKKLNRAEMTKPEILQDFEFYVAYCRGQLGISTGDEGEQRAAAGALVGLARKNGNTHHFYELNELVGRLAMELGQNGNSYFERLLQSTDPLYQATGGYWLGESELTAGNYDAAKNHFQGVTKLANNSEEVQQIKQLSKVGLALCQLNSDDAAGALKTLDRLAADNDSTELELFARISNARGACHIALGQPKQALTRYLQTDLLFFTDPITHAESLYHLSQLWAEIGEASRAADTKARLKKRYASSSWAKKS